MSVSDDVVFSLLGEPLCLDLVNTISGHGEARVDLLPDAVALQAWLTAQSDRFRWDDHCTDDDVSTVHALRLAINDLLNARKTQEPDRDAMGILNGALHSYHGPELTWADGEFSISSQQHESRFAGVLHLIAADTVSLLTGPSKTLIRTCAHPDCTMRFVATNPRRRWCSAAGCGNRARVARSYRRKGG